MGDVRSGASIAVLIGGTMVGPCRRPDARTSRRRCSLRARPGWVTTVWSPEFRGHCILPPAPDRHGRLRGPRMPVRSTPGSVDSLGFSCSGSSQWQPGQPVLANAERAERQKDRATAHRLLEVGGPSSPSGSREAAILSTGASPSSMSFEPSPSGEGSNGTPLQPTAETLRPFQRR